MAGFHFRKQIRRFSKSVLNTRIKGEKDKYGKSLFSFPWEVAQANFLIELLPLFLFFLAFSPSPFLLLSEGPNDGSHFSPASERGSISSFFPQLKRRPQNKPPTYIRPSLALSSSNTRCVKPPLAVTGSYDSPRGETNNVCRKVSGFIHFRKRRKHLCVV